MEAFSVLVPDGWSFEDDVRWAPDDTLMPAKCTFKASGGGVNVQALPGKAFTWTSLIQVRLNHPIGSRYLGGIFCPRPGATDFIGEVIVPSLRHRAAYVTITDQGPYGAMDGSLGFDVGFKSTGTASTEGSRLRIEYVEGGKQYEEELFCTLTSFTYTIPAGGSMFTFMIWMADNMFSFRAEKGSLDGNVGVLQAMMHSLRLNPRWLETYNRIVTALKDNPARHPVSLRQLSDEAAGARAVNDAAGYALRQSIYGWIADNLCRAKATLEYYDPIQQVGVRLPAGHRQAWANDDGDYILSDLSDLLPGTGRAWKIMEPIGPDPQGFEPPAAAGIS